MRRFTLAVLTIGVLALALATFAPKAASISVPVKAAEQCTSPCSAEDGATDKENHFVYCHVDHGGEGHLICPSVSSIAQHFAKHDQDFCVDTPEQQAECLAKK